MREMLGCSASAGRRADCASAPPTRTGYWARCWVSACTASRNAKASSHPHRNFLEATMQDTCELNPRMPAAQSKQDTAHDTPLGKKAKKSTRAMATNKANGGTACIAKEDPDDTAVFSLNVFSEKAGEFGAAGSVDVSEHSVANATASSAEDGADRKATADLAEPAEGKRLLHGGAAFPSLTENDGTRKSSEKARAPQGSSGKPRRVSRG